MNILFPGRHHLLTNFQYKYLQNIIKNNLKDIPDIYNKPLDIDDKINAVIFAITSANHFNTRRNPIPLHLRAMAIHEFDKTLDCQSLIYDIDDVGYLPNFAEYTLKRIYIRSNKKYDLTPDNTLVLCSTPSVIKMYENMGFKILPAELKDFRKTEYFEMLPWEIVTTLGKTKDWRNNNLFKEKVHDATRRIWLTYDIGDTVNLLFSDDLISADGDLTETRDYNSYVRGMDEIASIKYKETEKYIRPGRIGDIGCAVGSWIKLTCNDERFSESDFYGIEISRQLFDICEQRKHNMEFKNPFVFFYKRNAVTNPVFEKDSMNTIHTSSLTHEIKSYVSTSSINEYLTKNPGKSKNNAYEETGINQLKKFIELRYQELTPKGVWINRDVIAPENKDEFVYLYLNQNDGLNEVQNVQPDCPKNELKSYLDSLSTLGIFRQFAKDFRQHEANQLLYEEIIINGKKYLKLKYQDACEFISKKDYTDNWYSEMHETFCFWNFSDWKNSLEQTGFKLHKESRTYRNDWIVENRLKNKVEFYEFINGNMQKIDYPDTHMILIAIKT